MPANLQRVSWAIGGAQLLLVAFGALSAAQRVHPELASGARIKLVAPAANVPWSATAIIDSIGMDTLYVRSLSEPPQLRAASRVPIPFGSIRRLAISGGRASRVGRAGRGALWGLAVYAIFAAGYFAQVKSTCQCSDDGMAWIGLAAGIPWSAGVGAVIGAALPAEHWHRVTLDGKQ